MLCGWKWETVALRTITRAASFYGAEERFDLSMGALQQIATLETTHPGRKLIFWISPGWPLLTGPDVQLDGKEQQRLFGAIVEASTELRQANIALYNINPLGASEDSQRTFYDEQFVKGVTKPYQVNVASLGLQVLAVQTGGLVLNANNDITAVLQQAFADADAWYELTFSPHTPTTPTSTTNLRYRSTSAVSSPAPARVIMRSRNSGCASFRSRSWTPPTSPIGAAHRG